MEFKKLILPFIMSSSRDKNASLMASSMFESEKEECGATKLQSNLPQTCQTKGYNNE
jgi:hypothetical protein